MLFSFRFPSISTLNTLKGFVTEQKPVEPNRVCMKEQQHTHTLLMCVKRTSNYTYFNLV